MEPIDIIYTPLDIPPIPDNFDINKFKQWCKDVYPQKHLRRARLKVPEVLFGEQYPWDLAWPYVCGWLDDFEKIFPEMADYFCQAFGLEIQDIETISLLPVRDNIQGLGFWHFDKDISGLRLYIENTEPDENPILFRQTRIPYTVQNEKYAGWLSKKLNISVPWLDDKILTGKILRPRQAFYINNIRSVHSPYITKKSDRISCIIQGNPRTEKIIQQKTKDLIVRSAEKYRDYALFWN